MTDEIRQYLRYLRLNGACQASRDWVAMQTSVQQAWDDCPSRDWLLWAVAVAANTKADFRRLGAAVAMCYVRYWDGLTRNTGRTYETDPILRQTLLWGLGQVEFADLPVAAKIQPYLRDDDDHIENVGGDYWRLLRLMVRVEWGRLDNTSRRSFQYLASAEMFADSVRFQAFFRRTFREYYPHPPVVDVNSTVPAGNIAV